MLIICFGVGHNLMCSGKSGVGHNLMCSGKSGVILQVVEVSETSPENLAIWMLLKLGFSLLHCSSTREESHNCPMNN